jgi:uncharacterized protein YegP (UPF0339 family)
MAAKFEVFQDTEGQYRFQLKAANGEVVADSQNYQTLADVRAGIAAVQRAASEAHVPDTDAGLDIQNGIYMHYDQRPRE